jgi:ribosomal protein S18 acetylase RimI-like enzyme
MKIDLIIASTDEHYSNAAELFKEYAHWLNIDLTFQHFEEELSQLKSMYGLPLGAVILAKIDNDIVACVAIRNLENQIAELKRMFVKPAFRHQSIAQNLLHKATEFAIGTGYKSIRLDTLNTMTPAMNLYTKNGFKQIEAYYHNPLETAVYFEKTIS